MAEVFDPADVPDFAAQQANYEQQVKLAEYLRKVAGNASESANGMMTQQGFVSPGKAGLLNSFIQNLAANMAEDKASKTQLANVAAQASHAKQWRNSAFPQALAAKPMQVDETADTVVAPAQAAQPVTLAQVLKKTLSAGGNPLLAKEAAAYEKYGMAEVDREDRQVASKDLKDTALAQTRAQMIATMEDKAARLAEQIRATNQSDATRRQLAAEHNATLIALKEMGRGLAGNNANQRRLDQIDAADERAIERLSTKAQLLSPMINGAQQVQDLLDATSGKSIPGVGYVGKLPPILLSKEGNLNRQKIKMFANAMLRNQAGLSQTLSETENAQLELLADGRFSQAEFEAAWPSLMEKVNSSVHATRAGYKPNVISTFEERGGPISLVQSKKKPVAPISVGDGQLSPAELAELAALRARFPKGQ